MIENAVVVVVDALRADRVGAYNDDYADLTPTINRLAAEGTAFTRAFSTTNTTDPAMTSFHTGRHPKGHGVRNHGDRVTNEEKARVDAVEMLPETLSRHGLRTIKMGRALGRWHKRGFGTYPEVGGFEETDKHPVVAFWDEHFETRVGRLLHRISGSLGHWVATTYRDFRTDEASVMDDCLAAIDDGAEGPFYALVHLMDTHASYNPRDELIRENLGRYDEAENTPLVDLADNYGIDTVTGERCEYWSRRYSNWADERHGVGTAHVEARYDGGVREADEKIGRLVAGLQGRDLLDETMVVVLADHGESLTEHGILHDHHGLYEQTIRIPLVIWTPEDPPGLCDEFVGITDVAPTILDYLEVDHDLSFDGRSLRPLLGAADGVVPPSWPERKAVVAEEAHTQRRRMVRTREAKYICLLEGDKACRYCGVEHAPPEELYDLVEDPGETTSLAAEQPERIKRLQHIQDSVYSDLTEPPEPDDRSIDHEDEADIIERFEALGYR